MPFVPLIPFVCCARSSSLRVSAAGKSGSTLILLRSSLRQSPGRKKHTSSLDWISGMRGKRSRPSYAIRSGRPKYRKRDSPCQEGGERHAESRPSSRAGSKNEKKNGVCRRPFLQVGFRRRRRNAAAISRVPVLFDAPHAWSYRLSWRAGRQGIVERTSKQFRSAPAVFRL
jgi:hypothetical protein